MGRFVVYYVYTKGKKGNTMQTAHTNRPTYAHGIVVALYYTKAVACYRGSVVTLYRGKVVTWWRGDVAERPALGRPGVPRAGVGS